MKRLSRMLGVTLLEIMLVLAVAAMIIVMSIRYYNSAVSSQQSNTVLQSIEAIQAGEDSIAQATGSYGVNTASGLGLPTSALVQPWTGAITITKGTNTFTINFTNVPAQVCGLIKGKLKANPRYTVANDCTTVVYTNS